jgi:hypothetical protein
MSASPDELEAIARFRGIADRLKGDRWTVETDSDGTHLLSFRTSHDEAILATFHLDALRAEIDLIAQGVPLLFQFLDMLDRATRRIRSLEHDLRRAQRPPEPKLREGNFAANAALLCKEPLFHRFLERKDTQGAIFDETQADAALKRVLHITSKTKFNTDVKAQSAWIDLRAEYDAWKERGRA